MSPSELGSGLFIQHTDKDVFVLVDGLHDLGMRLTKADQKGLKEVGEEVGKPTFEARLNFNHFKK